MLNKIKSLFKKKVEVETKPESKITSKQITQDEQVSYELKKQVEKLGLDGDNYIVNVVYVEFKPYKSVYESRSLVPYIRGNEFEIVMDEDYCGELTIYLSVFGNDSSKKGELKLIFKKAYISYLTGKLTVEKDSLVKNTL